jgi:hypothetical protein
MYNDDTIVSRIERLDPFFGDNRIVFEIKTLPALGIGIPDMHHKLESKEVILLNDIFVA